MFFSSDFPYSWDNALDKVYMTWSASIGPTKINSYGLVSGKLHIWKWLMEGTEPEQFFFTKDHLYIAYDAFLAEGVPSCIHRHFQCCLV